MIGNNEQGSNTANPMSVHVTPKIGKRSVNPRPFRHHALPFVQQVQLLIAGFQNQQMVSGELVGARFQRAPRNKTT
jgi:hypothetical protein